ncbi:hypothetical protein [Bradyrhizobium diazoefficiens]|uniref:hypothetical protein n=1 Tax=Bradyrhizobium diazoefficiens TaxID=1355477 RepID=UPI002729846A|nr:hypothetical protein [Bradyrhizobium diazoefficiens]WLA69186.1 hypothetical protein QNN01_22605 [Bradyrhizobium diazoefficiens]
MSAHKAPIYFEDNPRIDDVAFAVVPYDSFSGRVVASGVKATVEGLLDRPIRNLSGHLVFINLDQQAAYSVTIDASEAGYFSPVKATFPSAANPAAARRLVVPLVRGPSYPYAEATTLIRGVVVRSGKAVLGASISIGPASGAQFKTTSDGRGVFALPLSRRREPDESPSKPYLVKLYLNQGDDARTLDVMITEGQSHSFKEPIDLIEANEPKFFDSHEP